MKTKKQEIILKKLNGFQRVEQVAPNQTIIYFDKGLLTLFWI